MFESDYVLQVIKRFVQTVVMSLEPAIKERDFSKISESEEAVAQLLDLNAKTACSLAPESLASLMQLSGLGDSVAEYVVYALRRIGDAYDCAGQQSTAHIRREQAHAIAHTFGLSYNQVPVEFSEMEEVLSQQE